MRYGSSSRVSVSMVTRVATIVPLIRGKRTSSDRRPGRLSEVVEGEESSDALAALTLEPPKAPEVAAAEFDGAKTAVLTAAEQVPYAVA